MPLKRPRTALAALVILAAGLTAWSGAERRPTGPAFAEATAGAPAAARMLPRQIAFAQYNIHQGKGRDGALDLARTGECLTGMDVVSLNEVAGPDLFGAGGQTGPLADRLAMAGVFAPTERRFWSPHFGNALLSSAAPLDWFRIPLPHAESDSYRNALIATLPHPQGAIRVLVTHIDRGPDHDLQLAAALALFAALAPPAVLMGDLNTAAAEPRLRALLDTPGIISSNGSLHPEDSASGVDWIIAKGFAALSASACDTGGSDHPRVGLIAEPLP